MKKKVWVIIGILILALIGYGLYNYAYNTGYDNGHDNGYNAGYRAGQRECEESHYDYYTGYGYSDEGGITSSSVFVTMTGSKYHDGYCQYVVGKSNLSYYDNAYAAQLAGYSPCSVCQY